MTIQQPSPRFEREALVAFGSAVLRKLDVPEDHARITSDMLVEADERGVSTHGLMRLVPYARRLQTGLVNPRPSLKVDSRRPGFAMVDADDGLGQVTTSIGVDEAIRQSRAYGFAIVGLHNSHHLGMCAPYAERLAREGLIGVVMTNTAPLMAPTNSGKRLIGNNPLAIAMPRGNGAEPVVLDIAFTNVAFGAIIRMLSQGAEVPEGWVHDDQGEWIRDAATAVERGIMAPIGGHKGYGLALMVEFLTAALTDSYALDDVGSLFREPPVHMRVGHLIIAIDPDALIDRARFLSRVDEICGKVTAAAPTPGRGSVVLPGEPERAKLAESRRNGVPLAPAIIQQLTDFGREFDLALPEPIAVREMN